MKKNNKECNIRYLYNSGFLIETQNNVLIIDYSDSSDNIDLDKYKNKNIYVLITHNHMDHFNSIVFDWYYDYRVKYIVHEDIFVPNDIDVLYTTPYNNYTMDDLEVDTYGSTDLGVSFLIFVDDLVIFHSGDLNWWKWKSDSKEVQSKEELDFKNELDKIKDVEIDFSFVPVDPRLEEYYDLAVKYFAEVINTKVVIPMHFRDALKPVETLYNNWESFNYKPQFVLISERNQEFHFNGEFID